MKTIPMMILVGPSGAGKSSFVTRARIEFPDIFDTTTCTTRKMRAGESEGNPYHFISIEKFEELKGQGYFIEWAQVHGNFYGTPRDQIDQALAQGKLIIMDVDIQGARSFKKVYPGATTIFIMPPSVDELRKRVVSRHGGAPEDLELRMENAVKEIHLAEEFDCQIINDDFDKAYGQLQKMIEDLKESL